MKIFLVLACAFAVTAAGSKYHESERGGHGKHFESERPSDYGDHVRYKGREDENERGSQTSETIGYGAPGVVSSQLIGHSDHRDDYDNSLHSGSHYYGRNHGHGHGHSLGLSHGPLGIGGGGGGGHLGIGGGGGGLGSLGIGGGAGGLGPLNGGGLSLGPAGPGVGPLPPRISKSVFVFSAPPDPFELNAPRTIINRVPIRPQKHYQVVFINAPTPRPPPQQHIELPPHPELKTLVYVLVKKPLPVKPIKIHKPLPNPPSKPEVYFIRYKGHGPGLGHGIGPSHPGDYSEIGNGHGNLVDYADGPQYGPPGKHLVGESHYGPPGGALGSPIGSDNYDYGHEEAGSKLRFRKSNPPPEFDAGLSGI